jgi:hypothetical protein
MESSYEICLLDSDAASLSDSIACSTVRTCLTSKSTLGIHL